MHHPGGDRRGHDLLANGEASVGVGRPDARVPGERREGAPGRNAEGEPLPVQCPCRVRRSSREEKGGHLGQKYRHLAAQIGSKKKALVAIARKLLVLVYKLLGQCSPYEEPKPKDLTDEKRKKAVQRHLRELAKRGVQVDMTPEHLKIQPT